MFSFVRITLFCVLQVLDERAQMKRMQKKIKMLEEEVARLQSSQTAAEPTQLVAEGGGTEDVAVSVRIGEMSVKALIVIVSISKATNQTFFTYFGTR